MTRALIVVACGPGASIQDLGRFGWIAAGASAAGAADVLALYEGAALLGQPPNSAALELTGLGGTFRVTEPTRVALTGAPARATLDESALPWMSSALMHPGQTLTIGPPQQGNYSYLHLGGGIDTPPLMGSRATHLLARMGAPLAPGPLPLGPDPRSDVELTLDPFDRFGGGTLRIIESAQTDHFSAADRARLQATAFTRDTRGNRMGVRMVFDGDGFAAEGGLSLVSEVVVPGDIQIAGDGAPFILLCECQTTGGYPRIGTVIPPDLPRVAQARAGETLRFLFVSRDEALALHAAERQRRTARAPVPLRREPRDIADLLAYQLISGATRGDDL